MASLYELTGDFIKWADYLENTELEPELAAELTEALDNLGDDIADKMENCAKIIKNNESDIEGLKAEEARLRAKRQAKENANKRLKERMTAAMLLTVKPDKDGKRKLKTGLFSFGIQKNASVVIDEAYVENIPERYFKPRKPDDISRTKLKEDIEAGVDLSGIAHLETSESIRIR